MSSRITVKGRRQRRVGCRDGHLPVRKSGKNMERCETVLVRACFDSGGTTVGSGAAGGASPSGDGASAPSFSTGSPASSRFALRGGREVMSDDNKNGRGGTFWREASCRAALSCMFSSALASVSTLDAMHSRSSCGFHACPFGRTSSPLWFVRHAAWFSASDTGFCEEVQRQVQGTQKAVETHHEPHVPSSLADRLLHEVRSLGHIRLVRERLAVGPFRGRGGGVRQHHDGVEPHGGAERVRDGAQHGEVSKLGAARRVHAVEKKHDIRRAALCEGLRLGLQYPVRSQQSVPQHDTTCHDGAVVPRV